MERGSSPVRKVLAVAACLLFGVSCSDVGPRTVATTAVPTTRKPREADGDRKLRIGVLLPITGPGESLTPPLFRAIDMARDEINAQGGLFGNKVEIVRVDEGPNLATASMSLEQLFHESPVDAIIGPASSRIALGLRDQLSANAMPTCSPLASATALSTVADNGFFFRTIPSDALQAVAMATAIELTGGKSVSIVYSNDDYGSVFYQNLRTELTRRGITVLASVEYETAANQYRTVASRVFSGAQPDSVALIGAGDVGARVLAALRTNGAPKTKVIVNDGLRGAGISAQRPDANPFWLDGVQGVAPQAHTTNATWLKQYAESAGGLSDIYAAYAYDCVNLIALAALASDSESPAKLANGIISVSRSGVSCSSFASCKAELDNKRNIDLVGASGLLDLTDGGDISTGQFDNFTFDSNGSDSTKPLAITAG